MRILGWSGNEELATVFLGEVGRGTYVEFVESVEPPIPRNEKWVLIVSTLSGCPVGCRLCDAGASYLGKLDASDIMEQIDFLVTRRFPDRDIPVEKFKIQFARMGEPALNESVLDVLASLPSVYRAPGLLPCLSTVAPAGSEDFFAGLLDIKRSYYPKRFQLQFSLHTTDTGLRDWLIPCRKWAFAEIAAYGERFYVEGGRKITLNFAVADSMRIDPEVLLAHFRPEIFLIKMTPVNPTYEARNNNLSSQILPGNNGHPVMRSLRDSGYEVIWSMGELEENHIGSNCGQFLLRHLRENDNFRDGYTRPLHKPSGASTKGLEVSSACE